MKSVVIDANILIKLFRLESDTEIAQNCLTYIVENDITVIAPQLLITEAMNVCISQGIDREILLNFFDAQLQNRLQITDLDISILRKASEISQKGSPKSGYPCFNDSIYHAIAIENEITMITADKRHFLKTEEFGHIKMLKDWEDLFIA